LLAVVVIVSLFTLPSAQAQVYTTWGWRYDGDAASVYRSRVELDSLLNLHRWWLMGDSLGQRLDLEGVSLMHANLAGAMLEDANLKAVTLTYADLMRSDLRVADLTGANLIMTVLDSAHMTQSLLTDVVFEPRSLPDIPSIAQAFGLKQMRYDTNPTALTQLREAFSELGFKQ